MQSMATAVVVTQSRYLCHNPLQALGYESNICNNVCFQMLIGLLASADVMCASPLLSYYLNKWVFFGQW